MPAGPRHAVVVGVDAHFDDVVEQEPGLHAHVLRRKHRTEHNDLPVHLRCDQNLRRDAVGSTKFRSHGQVTCVAIAIGAHVGALNDSDYVAEITSVQNTGVEFLEQIVEAVQPHRSGTVARLWAADQADDIGARLAVPSSFVVLISTAPKRRTGGLTQ